MNRRGFMRALGMGAAAAPIAGKQIAEEAAAKLAGVYTGGGISSAGLSAAPQSSDDPSPEAYRFSLKIPHVREEVERMLFQQERLVGYIDPDIAVMRSVSLSAKICYQRKRNVERRMEELQNEWPWQRLRKLVSGSFVGKLLGGT